MNKVEFSTLPLTESMLSNIKTLDYQYMTAIQSQSLPLIIEGRDLLAQAKTGSGKTAAFAIGLLHKLDVQVYQTQAMVICPTRELADQVANDIRRLARFLPNTKIATLCGGKPIATQLTSLERPPHIVIGTPGRIAKHLQKGSLKLEKLNTLVLDEADRMLDMGFHDDIMKIINQLPKKRQTLLFSATYPDEIKKISNTIQINPADVRVDEIQDKKYIKQIAYEIGENARTPTLLSLLRHYQPDSCVIFCNRKQQCQELTDELWRLGFHALSLHGDHDQKKRDQVLVQFSNKSSSILVATDVAARGLDIKELSLVVNFELSPDPEVYVHRIGRTGRAGQDGIAASLFIKSEQRKLTAIEEYQQAKIALSTPSSLKENVSKLIPMMVTICISGGRKSKVRPGDILGALTANKELTGNQIGKINISDNVSYVAVERDVAKQALTILSDGKIKGRMFKVRLLY